MYEMSMKNLAAIKRCLTSVSIQLSQNTIMIQTNYSLEKGKMKPEVLLYSNQTRL